MKHLAKISIFILSISVLGLFTRCSNESKKAKEDTTVLTDIKKGDVKQDVEEFIYPLPTPFEVTEMLNRIGASYILSLSNAADNAEKYFTEKAKALNLGIYSADLSYASTYNQKQNVIDYMNASNKLIEELGFADVVDKSMLEEIETIENDKDKLVELVTNTFYKSYKYLNKTGRGPVSVLILTGSWVEGLYLATHISEDTYNNVEMVKIIMMQKASLNNLMKIINENKANPYMAEVGESLGSLHGIFNSLEEGSISHDQMEAITKEVYNLRTEIVK